MRRLALLSAVLLLSACDPYALARRQAALQAYVGHSESDIVRVFGVPTRTFETGGHRFLAYDQGGVELIPSPYPWGPWGWGGFGWSYAGDFPVRAVERGCETTFEVSADHVVGVTLHGNACA